MKAKVLSIFSSHATPSTRDLPLDDGTSKGNLNLPSSPDSGSATEEPTRTWSQKKVIWLIALGFLGVAIVVIVITLPIVLLRRRGPPDDPSYADMANRPLLVADNFPDPGLLYANGTWFAYATTAAINNSKIPHIPVATSQDFKNWTRIQGHDVLPNIGKWEINVNHWAPDVVQRDDGKFVLYYSGELKTWRRHHCVGAAVSEEKNPLGPFRPRQEPLACPRTQGGAIDPSPFKDNDGKLYVAYKADGNSIGHGGNCNNSKKPLMNVPIMLQELESDGVTPVGDPVEILRNEKSDGPLVEAPSIIRTEQGIYYLFFSSHCFDSPEYDVRYAYSTSLKGPYTRAARSLLKKGDFGLKSPGGATVSRDGRRMVFHASCNSGRCMYAAGISISVNSTITLTQL